MEFVSSKIHQQRGSYIFSKSWKLNLDLENAKKKKKLENIFHFWDKCIRICCNRLPLLRREYLSLAFNGLTNSPKVLHIIKRDFFLLNCLRRDQFIWLSCCRSDINSFSAHLSCYLLKGPLKKDFLDFYLTMYFRVRKFKNRSAMRVIFFWKCSNLNLNLQKKKKIEKLFFVSEIIVSENVTLKILY